ncbi:MAG TPA: thioredoxin [Candidatus Polarisedimenticolia bacterium]|nr:thioredoxin [Candidatus Polarisedimenticolia bacterium]
MSAVVDVDDESFDSEVLNSNIPVLVDVSAEWCGPCKRLEPIVAEIASEYAGRLKVARLDVDRAQATAVRYGIMSVPTLLFFKKGQVQDQLLGYVPKDRLVAKIDPIL